MEILIGNTGFVGSNLAQCKGFDMLFNSKNVKEAYGMQPELMVYAGVTGTKFLANQYPVEDEIHIKETIANIEKINPKFLVLISTVDVYPIARNVDESTEINTEQLHPYGKNRYMLEQWVISHIKEYLIVRLPAIYGSNLKKNFIYDLTYKVPPLLKEEIVMNVKEKNPEIEKYYDKQVNAYYKCKSLQGYEERELVELLKRYNISSLNYTDSRAVYQFYNLKYLWKHIEVAKKCGIKLLNITTEPVSAKELYEYIEGKEFSNEIMDCPIEYDVKTKFHKLFGGSNGYIFSKMEVMNDVRKYVYENRRI